MSEQGSANSFSGETSIERCEKVLFHYLNQAPFSYSLWRTLEYKQLESLEFPEPILDLGCGDGIFSDILFKNLEVIGTDINHRELTIARKFGTHQSMAVTDARALPFKNESFASVLSNCVIEHIPGSQNVINEAYRILKPGGVFILTVPTENFTPNLFFVTLFNKLHLGFAARWYGKFLNRALKHFNMFTVSEWVSQVENAGFNVEVNKQFISPESIAIFDLLVTLSFSSYVNRKIVGRWAAFPFLRKRLAGPIFNWGKKYIQETGEIGGCVLLVARKKV